MLLDFDATHQIFRNKFPKAKEEMEERLKVRTCMHKWTFSLLSFISFFVSEVEGISNDFLPCLPLSSSLLSLYLFL